MDSSVCMIKRGNYLNWISCLKKTHEKTTTKITPSYFFAQHRNVRTNKLQTNTYCVIDNQGEFENLENSTPSAYGFSLVVCIHK